MLLVLLLLLGVAAAQANEVVLCGRDLEKAHALYCYGIHLADDEIPDIPSSKSPKLKSVQMPARFAFRARRSAEGVLKTHDLVENCCLKPCHISEVVNYC